MERQFYTAEDLKNWERLMAAWANSYAHPIYETFIRPLRLMAVTPDKVIAAFPNLYRLQGMFRRYVMELEPVIRNTFGMDRLFEVIDASEVEKRLEELRELALNPHYTFDNFVVGESNHFAYAASVAAAEAPGESYNPLFIYGAVGLGKTHLMNAIGNHIRRAHPDTRVLYITSESFTNQLVDLLTKRHTVAPLREKMRTVDVLIVDDVQFFAGKQQTQQEFFGTFNELYARQKQIVLAADRPPNEMPTLEERLRTRFSQGLLVDIQRPNFETRCAILRRKCEEQQIELPNDVIETIAGYVDGSIRELEGALNRVHARAKLLNQTVTADTVREALGDLARSDKRVITADTILDEVCSRFSISREEITSTRRSRDIAQPRQVAMYLCRKLTGMSTTQIGRLFGGRDHTTVMHSLDVVAGEYERDPAYRMKVDELVNRIKNA